MITTKIQYLIMVLSPIGKPPIVDITCCCVARARIACSYFDSTLCMSQEKEFLCYKVRHVNKFLYTIQFIHRHANPNVDSHSTMVF